MGVEEFLDHSASGKGAGLFLRSWRDPKEGDEAKIMVWLHTMVGFVARWSHRLPRIVVREDRDSGEARKEVWGGTWKCWEAEKLLKRQFYRDDDGEREVPPIICPTCLLAEYVEQQIRAGDLSWVEPIFRYEGTDPDKSITIHAGGFVSRFRPPRNKEFTPKQKGELKKAGIDLRQAFRENGLARCQYVFTVVDDAHPDNGIQITTEAEALGKAMQAKIRDRIDDLGREKGNPLKTPIAWQWEYDETKAFDKKYRVVPKTSVEMSDEIKELICSTDPPDLSEFLEPGNVEELRADFERYALIDFPFDEIFEPSEKASAAKKKEREETEEAVPKKRGRERTPEVESKKERAEPERERRRSRDDDRKSEPERETKTASPPPADDELFECDHCKVGRMKGDDVECPKCHTVYDVDTGSMIGRPCQKCAEIIDLEAADEKIICGKCGAIHVTKTWELAEQPKKADEPPKRRSLAAKRDAPKDESKPEPKAEAKSKPRDEPAVEGGGGKPKEPWDDDDDLPWQEEEPSKKKGKE